MKFNVSSLISLIFSFLAILYIMLKGRLKINTIAEVFVIWLVSLLPFVGLCIVNYGTLGFNGIREWIRLLTIFFTYIIFFNLVNKKNIFKILNLLFLSLIIPLISGCYQFFTYSGLIDATGAHRIYGTFAHPNAFALYLVLFIGASYWKIKVSNYKLPWFLLFIILLGFLVATASITGYIMFGIFSFSIFLREKFKYKIIIVFIIILTFFLILKTDAFQKRLERLKLIDLEATIEEGKVVDSFTWRLVNWNNLYALFKERPILGYGFQTIDIINPWKTKERIGYAAHNDFLKYLVETGLSGFIFYLFFTIIIWFEIYKEYKISKNPINKEFLFILFAIYTSWQAGSLADNFITATTFQFFYWTMLGTALKFNRLQYEKN